MARIVELERQAQQATEAPPVSAGCQMVAFAGLRSRLKSRGTAVICGLMGPDHCVVGLPLPLSPPPTPSPNPIPLPSHR
jgi:hypothetical protein